jgi:hypothetical protein
MNPQLESRDYNNMNTNGDGDDSAMIDDGDDMHSSFDPDGGEVGALLLVPPPVLF